MVILERHCNLCAIATIISFAEWVSYLWQPQTCCFMRPVCQVPEALCAGRICVGSCLWEHWEDISMFYLYCSAPFAATHYSSSHSSEGVYCITNFLFGTRLYADMNLTVWNKVSIEILKMHFSLSEVAGVVGFMEVGVELISSFHQNDKSTGI